MVSAYVLVQTEAGQAAEVARRMREVPGVSRADDVLGPYDVVVQCSAEDADQLGHLVATVLPGVSGVTRTLTNVVVRL